MKKENWLVVSIILLLVALLAILPRAFDYQWTFWSPEGSKAAPVVENTATPVVENTATPAEENTVTPAAEAATEVPATEAPATEVPAAEEVVEMPLLDCGSFGTYTPVSVGDNWEYWMQEPLKVTGQYGLVDLKIKGGECKFSVPDGYIAILNQSAGIVYINDIKGSLGNPVKVDGSEMLTGNIVSQWGTKNDSAGVMIMLIPE